MCDSKAKANTKIDKLTLAMNRLASALEKSMTPPAQTDIQITFSEAASVDVSRAMGKVPRQRG
jgi:hypothetical protein